MTTLTVDAVDQTDYLQDRSLRFKLQTLDFTLIDPATDPTMGDVVAVDDPEWGGTITTRELNPYHSATDVRFVKVTATNNHIALGDDAPFELSDTPDDVTSFGYADFSIREQVNDTVLERRLSCRVFEPGLVPGMQVVITNAAEGLSGVTYTITEVDVGFPTDTDPTFDIECSEGGFDEAIPPVTLTTVIDSSSGSCRVGTAVPHTHPTAYYGEMYAGGIGATLVGDPLEDVQFIDQSLTTALKFIEGSELVIVGSHLVIPASVVGSAGIARVVDEIGDARIYARIKCPPPGSGGGAGGDPVAVYDTDCVSSLAWAEDSSTDMTVTPTGTLVEFDATGTYGDATASLTATPSVLDQDDFVVSFTFEVNSTVFTPDALDTELDIRVLPGGFELMMGAWFRTGANAGIDSLIIGIGGVDTSHNFTWMSATTYTVVFTYSSTGISSVYVNGVGRAAAGASGIPAISVGVFDALVGEHLEVTVDLDDFCTVQP